ncbi:hypothetical protein KOI35_22340 [Actinoplanes bogorensis]|uniref:Uncharacterized protein n=1 Tax=Paractinoplanes bogorensis TaxID=1610840 RepID=A0ABS5YS25_9ACTN|nr:hypothetical protein [Actinoplanes bogorensis]MBU2666245.1 hypothetical protein [Actinoplanes bogorensis]
MDTELHVSYHAFGIIDDDLDWPLDPPPSGNGLIHPFRGGAFVSTGIHSGRIVVRTGAFDAAPPVDAGHGWESIVEVSVSSRRGKLRVRSYDDDPEGTTLSTAGRGSYRVRAYAAGRDTDIDGTSPLVETYRIEVWPAAATTSLVLRAEDRYGEQVMREMSSDEPSDPRDGQAMNEPVF